MKTRSLGYGIATLALGAALLTTHAHSLYCLSTLGGSRATPMACLRMGE